MRNFRTQFEFSNTTEQATIKEQVIKLRREMFIITLYIMYFIGDYLFGLLQPLIYAIGRLAWSSLVTSTLVSRCHLWK